VIIGNLIILLLGLGILVSAIPSGIL
jgi:hypothetical protein